MELDLLNDLLNRTVSDLFTNKEKHISYLSYIDDECFSTSNFYIHPSINNHKKKISKTLQENYILDSNKQKDEPRKNKILKRQLNINEKPEEEKIKPEVKEWINNIGKLFFEESMKIIGLDEKKLKSKFYTNFSLEQLINEKSKVKRELRKYDEYFKERFKQNPNNEEKEILKPLYIYYKSLKLWIAKKEQQKEKENTSASDIQANNSTFIDKNDNKALFEIRKYNKTEIFDIEKKYMIIIKEQNALKEMLHKYQDDFIRTNNRKIKFIRDIEPVKREYDLYKLNKKKIKEIQNIINEIMIKKE